MSHVALAEKLIFTFVRGGQGVVTCEEMILHVINHKAYHVQNHC